LCAIETGGPTHAGRCTFHMERGNLICTLPSGRRLVYRNARLEDVRDRVPWEARGPVWAAVYWSPRYGWKYLYGGALAENIVQAISRDVMACGMVRVEESGFMPIVLHCHDEIVSSTREQHYGEFMRCVTTCPDWLDGFPLDAEGGLSPRYAKSPPPGVREQVWRNGAFLKVA
jgi:DNA polymerase bacteriophage-type